ncbi:OCIA domain-containing protein 2 [Bufo bufo]|uniref:OCIA domain-containing protein 2 n=1 Tax=Bufo bufo TaxID=8384 RepID=UPI001ABED5C3|nr:OCIA domain-containing protein 2 [Bufo bufo]
MAADPQQAPEQSTTPAPQKSLMHCPISQGNREEFRKVFKECKEESFWYRALPLSVTSMIATQALIFQGYLSKNIRFGSLPKLALAGFLGFAVGKISYFGTCQKKFEKLGVQNPFEAAFAPGMAGGFDPGFFPNHNKHCHHVCEECKKKCAKDKEQSAQPATNSS